MLNIRGEQIVWVENTDSKDSTICQGSVFDHHIKAQLSPSQSLHIFAHWLSHKAAVVWPWSNCLRREEFQLQPEDPAAGEHRFGAVRNCWANSRCAQATTLTALERLLRHRSHAARPHWEVEIFFNSRSSPTWLTLMLLSIFCFTVYEI